jgi:protein-S-isoprenylcysteine O-methyltransferase Ste14
MGVMDRLPTLGPRGEGWVILQGVLLTVAALAGLAGLRAPAWGDPARLLTSVAGAGLIGLGAIQAWRGLRDLGRNLTPLPHPNADAEFVETGIYRRVRHPIYGGGLLAAFGWGLLTASPVALVVAVVAVPFFWLKSSVEERWLVQRFPGYPAYRRRTHRFIAWPG